jgi:hypothetical protein
MFTRQELIAELPRLAAADSPPLEVTQFGSKEFIAPDQPPQQTWPATLVSASSWSTQAGRAAELGR